MNSTVVLFGRIREYYPSASEDCDANFSVLFRSFLGLLPSKSKMLLIIISDNSEQCYSHPSS